MSLDKAIEHGKERRRAYRGAKAIDATCRNHGSCEWCRQNRQHKFRDKNGDDEMRLETRYIADDGKSFDTEAECLNYERKKSGIFDGVIFLDRDFKRVPDDFDEIHDKSWYMVIVDTSKAADLFYALHLHERCFEPPEEYNTGDIFAWDDDNNYEWYDLKASARKYGRMLASVEKAVSAK